MLAEMERCQPKHRQCSQFHATLVMDYVEERQRQEMALEEESNGYATEAAMLAEDNPLITFKRWLVDSARLRGRRDQ